MEFFDLDAVSQFSDQLHRKREIPPDLQVKRQTSGGKSRAGATGFRASLPMNDAEEIFAVCTFSLCGLDNSPRVAGNLRIVTRKFSLEILPGNRTMKCFLASLIALN